MLVSKESGAKIQFGKLPIVTGSSSPSDVWSLGCLLFELFTGNLLYPDSEDFSKFFSVLTGTADEVCAAYSCNLTQLSSAISMAYAGQKVLWFSSESAVKHSLHARLQRVASIST